MNTICKDVSREDHNVGKQDREIHEMVVQTGLELISERLCRLIEQGNTTGDFHVEHPKATAVMIVPLVSKYVYRSKRVKEVIPTKMMEPTFSKTIDQMLMRHEFSLY